MRKLSLFLLTNRAYLSNSHSATTNHTFDYGRAGDVPFAGGWNGRGFDTVGSTRVTRNLRLLVAAVFAFCAMGMSDCERHRGSVRDGTAFINNDPDDVLASPDWLSNFKVENGKMVLRAPERIVWESSQLFVPPGDYALLHSNGDLALHDFSLQNPPRLWGTGSVSGTTGATLHLRNDSLLYIKDQNGQTIWWSWRKPCNGPINSDFGPREPLAPGRELVS